MSADLERLKKIMMSQDINVEDERMIRAFRLFENPSGCEWCGGRTKVGVVVPAKGKTPEYVKLACCGKKVS
jgi:hypothetical protein